MSKELSLKKPQKACINCKHGEIDDKYHGYTHCTIYNASFKSDSRCKKYEKE